MQNTTAKKKVRNLPQAFQKLRNETKAVNVIKRAFNNFKINKTKRNAAKTIARSSRGITNYQEIANKNVSPLDTLARYQAYFESYVRALLFPELVRNAKIPSIVPQETTSLHKHWTIPLTTSTSGKMAIHFNPFLYSDTGAASSALEADQTTTLTLLTPDTVGGSTTIAMSFGAPPLTFATYRLVSCSIILVPQMSVTTAQGTIGGGIYLGNTFPANAAGTVNHYSADQLTVASNIDNLLYYNEANLTALQSLRMVYFPVDPTYEAYLPLNSPHSAVYNTDFIFALYVNGTQATAAFNLEIYCNYEMTPYIVTESYLPASMYRGDEDINKVVKKVAQQQSHVSQVGTNIQSEIECVDDNMAQGKNTGIFQSAMNFLGDHKREILDFGIKALTAMAS